ncbi:MAG: PP2C family protein-serine/threonine phosphatase [Fibrobacterota bacterium]
MDIHDESRQIIDELTAENARLQQDLMNSTVVTRFTNLLYGVTTIDEVIGILLYSIQDITSFRRTVYFSLDYERYSLYVERSYGFSRAAQDRMNKEITVGELDDDLKRVIFEGTPFDIEEYGKKDEHILSRLLSSSNFVVLPLVKETSGYKGRDICFSSGDTPVERERKERLLLRSRNIPSLGFFWLDTMYMDEDEKARDISTLSEYIQNTGLIIDNILMIQEMKKVNTKNAVELNRARMVQEALLPSVLPHNGKISAASHYIPQEEVGGDYYDIFKTAPEIYNIVIADVSGHGPSSALVMGMIKVLLRQYAEADMDTAAVLENINEVLVRHVPAGKFVTIFYARLDLASGTMTYTSAGHCPVYVVDRPTKVLRRLTSDGTFIGMFKEFSLPQNTISFTKGQSRIFLYTDGITEAMDKDSRQFGESRLEDCVAEGAAMPPRQSVRHVLDTVNAHIGGVPLEDDLTLCIIDV